MPKNSKTFKDQNPTTYRGEKISKTQNKHLITSTKIEKKKWGTIRTTIPKQIIGTILPPKEKINEIEWYKDRNGNITIEVKT